MKGGPRFLSLRAARVLSSGSPLVIIGSASLAGCLAVLAGGGGPVLWFGVGAAPALAVLGGEVWRRSLLREESERQLERAERLMCLLEESPDPARRRLAWAVRNSAHFEALAGGGFFSSRHAFLLTPEGAGEGDRRLAVLEAHASGEALPPGAIRDLMRDVPWPRLPVPSTGDRARAARQLLAALWTEATRAGEGEELALRMAAHEMARLLPRDGEESPSWEAAFRALAASLPRWHEERGRGFPASPSDGTRLPPLLELALRDGPDRA